MRIACCVPIPPSLPSRKARVAQDRDRRVDVRILDRLLPVARRLPDRRVKVRWAIVHRAAPGNRRVVAGCGVKA